MSANYFKQVHKQYIFNYYCVSISENVGDMTPEYNELDHTNNNKILLTYIILILTKNKLIQYLRQSSGTKARAAILNFNLQFRNLSVKCVHVVHSYALSYGAKLPS